MITVGIRNLRDSLSKYISSVKSGETILVTDHDRIVAEIRPVSVSGEKSNILDLYISEQSERNRLLKSTVRMKLEKKKRKEKYDMPIIKKIYDDTRSDR